MKPLNLYDIASCDHAIFARIAKNGEIEVEVWNEEEKIVYHEISHRFAWDSLVSFAKMVLQQDAKLNDNLS